MNPEQINARYRELQSYVGWTEEDAQRVAALGPLLEPALPALVDDFYAEIDRHADTRKALTGGPQQIQRLKGTLLQWLRELLSGRYDQDYTVRRWRVGWRHVEIGLDQVYTNASMSRLRRGLMQALDARWTGELPELLAAHRSLDMLLDLDLALIEDAYQTEYALRLQRTERLATIGQVAAGVAHELRNPLNVVKTSVYYLLNARNPTPEKMAEHLQRIERQVGLADSVITALSNLARLPVPNLRPLEPARQLREAAELNPVPANIQVEIECPADLPLLLADPDQLRIVLGNLIRNAREAMPEGGRLTLRARGGEGEVLLEVSDTGVGIPPENLARIMEPLYSTKARGLGLGLAIARAIIEKNQGSMTAHSTPGAGSTFTVRLPATTPAGEPAAP